MGLLFLTAWYVSGRNKRAGKTAGRGFEENIFFVGRGGGDPISAVSTTGNSSVAELAQDGA